LIFLFSPLHPLFLSLGSGKIIGGDGSPSSEMSTELFYGLVVGVPAGIVLIIALAALIIFTNTKIKRKVFPHMERRYFQAGGIGTS